MKEEQLSNKKYLNDQGVSQQDKLGSYLVT
jgi:hypothetical protein